MKIKEKLKTEKYVSEITRLVESGNCNLAIHKASRTEYDDYVLEKIESCGKFQILVIKLPEVNEKNTARKIKGREPKFKIVSLPGH